MNKRTIRLRRAQRTRIKLRELNKVRLCINKTSRNIYAQVISSDGSQVLVSASTVEKLIREDIHHGGNISSAEIIGRKIAERSVEKGIVDVSFDRSGFRYHGCIKALANSARKYGLNF